MAKRRKLEAPSAEDMTRIEEEFRRETPARSAVAPIAQVASEVADAYQPGTWPLTLVFGFCCSTFSKPGRPGLSVLR